MYSVTEANPNGRPGEFLSPCTRIPVLPPVTDTGAAQL